MSAIQSVTVYCSSSSAIAQTYVDAAVELGKVMAEQRWTLVYGGNRIGLMGRLADSIREHGGRVIGISPQYFIDKGVDDKHCDEFIVTECMRTRKAAMEARGDAYLALPGGLGTFEEIFEIIVGKQLGLHNKPIVLLNIAGYYQPFLEQIDQGIEQHFIKPAARSLFFVAQDVQSAVQHIRDYLPGPGADKRRVKTELADDQNVSSLR